MVKNQDTTATFKRSSSQQKMNKKTPFISVVISGYNDLELTKSLLASLFKTTCRDFEVLLIDDASPQDLSELKRLFPIRYLRNKVNLGVAKTRNIAAQKAKGEILLSLDNDVKPFGDLISEVYTFFKKHPKILAITGFPGTGAENPAFFAKYKYLRDWSYWHLEVDRKRFYYFRPAIGALRRDVYLELGGYDSRFCRPGMPAIEDLEFSYRLTQKGRIIFNPKMVVGHPFGGLGKLISTYFKRTTLFLEVLKEKRCFTGVATTSGEALTILLAVFSLSSLFLVIF